MRHAKTQVFQSGSTQATFLDYKVYSAVREQAGKKGLKYEAEALKY